MRFRAEKQAAESKQKSLGKPFLPKEKYSAGTELVFPALGWQKGKVASVRAGVNPAVGEFDVIAVEFEDEEGALHVFPGVVEVLLPERHVLVEGVHVWALVVVGTSEQRSQELHHC